jgi:hypothetical protein
MSSSVRAVRRRGERVAARARPARARVVMGEARPHRERGARNCGVVGRLSGRDAALAWSWSWSLGACARLLAPAMGHKPRGSRRSAPEEGVLDCGGTPRYNTHDVAAAVPRDGGVPARHVDLREVRVQQGDRGSRFLHRDLGARPVAGPGRSGLGPAREARRQRGRSHPEFRCSRRSSVRVSISGPWLCPVVTAPHRPRHSR